MSEAVRRWWGWASLALLLLATPLLLFPAGWRLWALAVIPLIALGHRLAVGCWLPRTPLDLPILLLLLMVGVSALVTYSLEVSLPKIAGVILGVTWFYVVSHLGRRRSGWWVCLLLFLGAGFGVAALGLVGTQWGRKIPALEPVLTRLPVQLDGLPGAESGFNPNEVAGALLWVIPPCAVLLLATLRNSLRLSAARGFLFAVCSLLFLLLATVLVTGTFVLTQSRIAYLALALTLVLLGLAALPARGRWLVLVALALFLAGFGAAVASQRLPDPVQVLFPDQESPDSLLAVRSLEGRVEIWSRALLGIQDFLFTGMGMNTFRRVVHVLYPMTRFSPSVDIAHAHNEFLQAALDLGVPGLIAFTALHIIAFWMLSQVRRGAPPCALPAPLSHNDSPAEAAGAVAQPPLSHSGAYGRGAGGEGPLTLALAGGLLAHMLYGLADAIALGAKPGVLFWMLLGLIASLHHRTCARDPSPPSPSRNDFR